MFRPAVKENETPRETQAFETALHIELNVFARSTKRFIYISKMVIFAIGNGNANKCNGMTEHRAMKYLDVGNAPRNLIRVISFVTILEFKLLTQKSAKV